MGTDRRVVEVIKITPTKVWVNLVSLLNTEHGICVSPCGFKIIPGDKMSWQGKRAYLMMSKSHDDHRKRAPYNCPLPRVEESPFYRNDAIDELPFLRRMIFKLTSKRHQFNSLNKCMMIMNEEQMKDEKLLKDGKKMGDQLEVLIKKYDDEHERLQSM